MPWRKHLYWQPNRQTKYWKCKPRICWHFAFPNVATLCFFSISFQFYVLTILCILVGLGSGRKTPWLVLIWLKLPGFDTTNTAREVLTSSQKYIFCHRKHGLKLSCVVLKKINCHHPINHEILSSNLCFLSMWYIDTNKLEFYCGLHTFLLPKLYSGSQVFI